MLKLRMDEQVYRADPAVSVHELIDFNNDIKKWEHFKKIKRKTTPAMQFGTDFHEYVLMGTEIKTVPIGMVSSVLEHPEWKYLLEKKRFVEGAIFNEIGGIQCKGRIDMVSDVIIDLKTSANASPRNFKRSVRDYGYDLQAAMYSELFRVETGEELDFVFVVVEKNDPYLCYFYRMTPETLRIAKEKLYSIIESYKAYTIFGRNIEEYLV